MLLHKTLTKVYFSSDLTCADHEMHRENHVPVRRHDLNCDELHFLLLRDDLPLRDGLLRLPLLLQGDTHESPHREHRFDEIHRRGLNRARHDRPPSSPWPRLRLKEHLKIHNQVPTSRGPLKRRLLI